MDDCYFIDPGCSLESAERTSTQVTRRANRKKRLTVLYIVEHPNQEGDTCIDWTSQYCWTNGWNCLWRGHSVYRNRPLIPPVRVDCHVCGVGASVSAAASLPLLPWAQTATKLFTLFPNCPPPTAFSSEPFPLPREGSHPGASGAKLPSHPAAIGLPESSLNSAPGPFHMRPRVVDLRHLPTAHSCVSWQRPRVRGRRPL